jgi:hypothetical protein
MTLPPALLQEQLVVVHCSKGLWSLKFKLRENHGGHKDLCGSGHQRVTPYVHERCVYCYMCCSSPRVELA